MEEQDQEQIQADIPAPEQKSKLKLFGIFDVANVEITDPGLKRVINIEPRLLLKSHGRARKEFAKTKVHVVERLICLLQVPGSRGKKHRIITSWSTGKYNRCAKIVFDALKIVQEKTNQNPIEVLMKAIVNSAPRDGVTAIEYGGARYPQSVDYSPIKRVNMVLRFLVHGAYDKAFNKKATITEAFAKEIILASQNSSESLAIQKKNDTEKQADAAR